MYNTKHHYGIGLLSSVLECFPGKTLDHGSDAAGVAIVSCHKSTRSPLDSFCFLSFVDPILWMRISLEVSRVFF